MTQPPPGYPPPPPGGFGPPPPPPGGYGPSPLQPAGHAPNNYLVWSILVTIFCCLPFGIYAIFKSSQVNGLWAEERYDEAQAAAGTARKWVIWSAVFGLIVIVIYVIIYAIFNTADTNAAMLAAMF